MRAPGCLLPAAGAPFSESCSPQPAAPFLLSVSSPPLLHRLSGLVGLGSGQRLSGRRPQSPQHGRAISPSRARAWARAPAAAAAAAASRAPTCRSPGVRASAAGLEGGSEGERRMWVAGRVCTAAQLRGSRREAPEGTGLLVLQLREDWCGRLPSSRLPLQSGGSLSETWSWGVGGGGGAPLHRISCEQRLEAATCLRQRDGFQVSLNPGTSTPRRMGYRNPE